ncbi:MAG: inorganic diphosphatase [Bacteroidota bacterium]
MYTKPLMLALLLLLIACGLEPSIDYTQVPALTEQGFHIVIEIPAGTNHKIEFNKENGRFENDLENGQTRVVDFLPYPGNYGFIPSTLMAESRGGDGDALDVLLIAESLPTGTVVEARPIAALVLRDNGEMDTKIIAQPVDSSLQIIDVQHYEDFMMRYNGAQNIIRNWFVQYKGLGKVDFLGWRNDDYALSEIKKWIIEQ